MQATSALAESSKKLDGVIEQADSTMASAKKAADDLQNAIADTRKVLRSATQGKGVVATLLNDQHVGQRSARANHQSANARRLVLPR